DEMLLVLDDYHLIDSAPVHESVAVLLENLPPGLRVAVSSRADPPLPLARLRARGQLAELRAADLRFTDQEAAALLGGVVGSGLARVGVGGAGGGGRGVVGAGLVGRGVVGSGLAGRGVAGSGLAEREAVGPDLPGPAVAALVARTEGWAAGLQLAGLSLRGQV